MEDIHKPTLQELCVRSEINFQKLATMSQVPTGIVYAVMAAGYDCSQDVAQKLLTTLAREMQWSNVTLDQVGGWRA
jgi:hypothetical protein